MRDFHDDYQRFLDEWEQMDGDQTPLSCRPLAKLAYRDIKTLVNHVRHWKARAQAAEAVSDVAGETILGNPEL